MTRLNKPCNDSSQVPNPSLERTSTGKPLGRLPGGVRSAQTLGRTGNLPVDSLLQVLQELEVELHHPGVRSSRLRLEQLLHPDVHEVGRSGRRYDRATIIKFLAEQSSPPSVESGEFSACLLSPGVALLTYCSAHRMADGSLSNHTFRSSVWVQVGGEWQRRYHQGTPAAQPW
jgi:hypothetical protein